MRIRSVPRLRRRRLNPPSSFDCCECFDCCDVVTAPHPSTRDIYERDSDRWHELRQPHGRSPARPFARWARRQARQHDLAGAIVDLGCGPGWFTGDLGQPAVAVDFAGAMLDKVPTYAPAAWRVQADLTRLPFRRHGLAGAWASKSLVHVPRREVPLALHDLHRALGVGAAVEFELFEGDLEFGPFADDDFPGRMFSSWPTDLLLDVLIGAGFTIVRHKLVRNDLGHLHHVVRASRARTLADTVGPEMRLLLCGLNPSVYSADVGSGFARPGNRFWPAALQAGIVNRDRDPRHALTAHGVGMTDLVKRATARADELANDEYRDGLRRLERLVAWLEPRAVCVIGLAGWRAAVNHKATAGVQRNHPIGGRPVYLMPNTSGLNAGSSLASLTEHLRGAAALADEA